MANRAIRRTRSAHSRIAANIRSIRAGQTAAPGHVLLFSPDVSRSVNFVVEALGMGLADRSQDVIAFCCARRNSDHHLMAFAKSPGIGFHHASFQVADPDQVGRAGRALVDKTRKGDWGFGRHTIGSNFFHYVQDPWGSWLEYYSDMDFIDDYALWSPTNYELVDSLASWVLPHRMILYTTTRSMRQWHPCDSLTDLEIETISAATRLHPRPSKPLVPEHPSPASVPSR